MDDSYTHEEWAAETAAIFEHASPPPACPQCRRSGFFGPRQAGARRYTLCKLCGYYQAVGEAPVQCRATMHGCAQWPRIAGARYIWWVRPAESTYECPHCHEIVVVEEAVVARPVDDPQHPWGRIPQHMTFEQAAAFWAKHGQGRVYL